MMRLKDLAVNDEIVLTQSNSQATYDCYKVQKITKTQITVNDKRFMKSTGQEVGTGDYHGSYDWHIADEWGSNSIVTWIEAEVKNQAIVERNKRIKLIVRIKKTAERLSPSRQYYDNDTLECIALELEGL